jgi:hypothetical protein
MGTGEVWLLVLIQENGPGVLRARGEKQNALPALRKSECLGIDHPIGPGEVSALQLFDEPGHCFPAIERQHEGDVL